MLFLLSLLFDTGIVIYFARLAFWLWVFLNKGEVSGIAVVCTTLLIKYALITYYLELEPMIGNDPVIAHTIEGKAPSIFTGMERK